MTVQDIKEHIYKVRELLNTLYSKLSDSTKLFNDMVNQTDRESAVIIIAGINSSHKELYSALMKTGTILGYLGEENPYPNDSEKEIGESKIARLNLVDSQQGDFNTVFKERAIGEIKSMRISLQETIISLDMFRVYESNNRKIVRLYDALIVNTIASKHWLGVVLDGLRTAELDEPDKMADLNNKENVLSNDSLPSVDKLTDNMADNPIDKE